MHGHYGTTAYLNEFLIGKNDKWPLKIWSRIPGDPMQRTPPRITMPLQRLAYATLLHDRLSEEQPHVNNLMDILIEIGSLIETACKVIKKQKEKAYQLQMSLTPSAMRKAQRAVEYQIAVARRIEKEREREVVRRENDIWAVSIAIWQAGGPSPPPRPSSLNRHTH